MGASYGAHLFTSAGYGAPFVTSRILLTEYNSVGQNIILSNRIQFCLTEYNSVQQNTNSVDRIVFCRQNTILSNIIRDVTNGAP